MDKLFPSPGVPPDPGIEPGCPASRADSLLSEPPGHEAVVQPDLTDAPRPYSLIRAQWDYITQYSLFLWPTNTQVPTHFFSLSWPTDTLVIIFDHFNKHIEILLILWLSVFGLFCNLTSTLSQGLYLQPQLQESHLFPAHMPMAFLSHCDFEPTDPITTQCLPPPWSPLFPLFLD